MQLHPESSQAGIWTQNLLTERQQCQQLPTCSFPLMETSIPLAMNQTSEQKSFGKSGGHYKHLAQKTLQKHCMSYQVALV